MANDRWKLKKEGKIYGPVDTETVRRWIEEERISPEDYVSGEDKEEWIEAKSLPQFEDLLGAAAKATSPPRGAVQCPHCGDTLPPEASFCGKCGANLKEGKKRGKRESSILSEQQLLFEPSSPGKKRGKGGSGILKGAAIAGILLLIMIIPLTVWGVLQGMDRLEGNLISLYITLVAYTVLYVIFVWGFKIVGEKYDNSLLKTASYLLIVVGIINCGLSIGMAIPPALDDVWVMVIGAVSAVIVGAVMIPFGIGLLRLKPEFGSLATNAGVLGIISGASVLTVILAFIGILLILPLYILLVILLFRAAEKLKTTPVV